MNHLALSFLVASSVLVARQPRETLRSPDFNQLSQEQFQQLLSKALSGPTKSFEAPALRVEVQNRVCSIPLSELKIEHPERFSMPKLPAGRKNLDPMTMPPPAPACKSWNQGK